MNFNTFRDTNKFIKTFEVVSYVPIHFDVKHDS